MGKRGLTLHMQFRLNFQEDYKGYHIKVGVHLHSQYGEGEGRLEAPLPYQTPAVYINENKIANTGLFRTKGWKEDDLAAAARQYIDEHPGLYPDQTNYDLSTLKVHADTPSNSETPFEDE